MVKRRTLHVVRNASLLNRVSMRHSVLAGNDKLDVFYVISSEQHVLVAYATAYKGLEGLILNVPTISMIQAHVPSVYMNTRP